MTRRYRAFISYSWADKDWAAWLHRTLETYRPPKGLIGKQTPLGRVPQRLHPIFRDRDEEAAGHGISASIEAAMADSEFLIVVCSPRSVKSEWVNKEIAWFKRHRAKERILALVIDGEPGISLREGASASEVSEECFPRTLLYEVDEHLHPTEQVEDLPLAADARKQGDGKRLARLKLAAALLGLGLDSLVKRDDRRRAGRLRWVAIGMGSVAVIMSALAIVAVQQRDLAREMQSAAEVQRNQAEGLIEFMIDDLRHKLEDDVQLQVLADIATRAQDYYVVQTEVRMDDDALGRRARVLDLLGDLKQDFGDSQAAAELLRESVAATAELLRRDPDNPQRIIEQAHSVQGLGALSFQSGDVASAERHMREAVELTHRLRELEPNDPEWISEHGSALVNLGVMRLNSNAVREAVNSFRDAVDIKRGGLDTAHNIDAARYDLSLTLAWLARALLRQGEIEAARTAWNKEAEVIDVMLGEDATNTVALRRRAVNHLNRAESFSNSRQFSTAHALAQQAVDDGQAFLASDPSNTLGIETAARAQLILGRIELMIGQVDQALSASTIADQLTRQLIDIDAHRFYWMGPLMGSNRILATKVRARKATTLVECLAALKGIQPEAHRLDALAQDHGGDAELAAVSAEALIMAGDAEALAGEPNQTEAYWRRALERLKDDVHESTTMDPARHHLLEALEQREQADNQQLQAFACGSTFT